MRVVRILRSIIEEMINKIYKRVLFVSIVKQGLIEYNYNEFNDYLVAVNGKEIRYDDLGNLVIYKDIPLVFNQKELKEYGDIFKLVLKEK